MKFFDRLIHKARLRRLSNFAVKACRTRQTISILIRHAYALTRAVELALIHTRKMEQAAASRLSVDGLVLACPRCGEYNDEARNVAVLGGFGGPLEATRSVSFGGPIVAALGQGRCPGCNGDTVNATFDLEIATQNYSLSTADAERKITTEKLERIAFSRLLNQVFGDRAAAKRLVQFERSRNPGASEIECIEAASRRIEEDNAGRWR